MIESGDGDELRPLELEPLEPGASGGEAHDGEPEASPLSAPHYALGRRRLHPVALACVVGTWNAGANVQLFPAVVGVLGYVAAPLLTLCVQAMAQVATVQLLRLKGFYDAQGQPVRCFSDVGERLAGPVGRRLFLVAQLLWQLTMLPALLNVLVHSTQQLFFHSEWLQCNALAGALVLGVAFLLAQATREWAHVQWIFVLALAGLVGMLAMLLAVAFLVEEEVALGGATPPLVGMFFELPELCAAPRAEGAAPAWNSTSLTVEALPDGACRKPDELYNLANVVRALSVLFFSYTPAVLVVEVASGAQLGPAETERAVTAGFWISTTASLVIGLCYAVRWGNQPPALVGQALPPILWARQLFDALVCLLTSSDLVALTLLVNHRLIELASLRNDLSCKGSAVWFASTLLSLALVFALCLLVPRLQDMLALVVSTCLIWAQFVLPLLFSLPPFSRLGRGLGADGSPAALAPALGPGTQALFWCILLGSAAFAVLQLASLVRNLVSLDLALATASSEDYWCKLVLGSSAI